MHNANFSKLNFLILILSCKTGCLCEDAIIWQPQHVYCKLELWKVLVLFWFSMYYLLVYCPALLLADV